MNLRSTTICISLALGACPLALAQKQQMRDAATHEQMAAALGKAQATDPMRHLPPSQGADPSKENQPQDIISRSDILCFNGLATLVPKAAILALPRSYADRIGIKPGAKLVTWQEFYAVNRGWVTAQEVNLTQAQGKEPLPETLSVRLAKSTNIVVATMQGGPISKLQYTPPPAAPATK